MISDRAQACYDKFQENIALALRIEEQLPADKAWSCVVRFYAAVQLVNAYAGVLIRRAPARASCRREPAKHLRSCCSTRER